VPPLNFVLYQTCLFISLFGKTVKRCLRSYEHQFQLLCPPSEYVAVQHFFQPGYVDREFALRWFGKALLLIVYRSRCFVFCSRASSSQPSHWYRSIKVWKKAVVPFSILKSRVTSPVSPVIRICGISWWIFCSQNLLLDEANLRLLLLKYDQYSECPLEGGGPLSNYGGGRSSHRNLKSLLPNFPTLSTLWNVVFDVFLR